MSIHITHRAGIQLAYERRGEGPLIVLVQGLGLPGRMWLELPVRLVDDGHLVVTPDARGTGLSDTPNPPYTMKVLADDLAAVIRDVDQGPALLVGISLGGMVIQRVALDHPELVSGLVLAATTCGLPHAKVPSPRFISLVAASAVLPIDPIIQAIRRMMVHPTSLERNPRLFHRWDEVQRSQPMPWQGIVGHMTAAATHSTGSSLGRIRCPTEVLAGADDQVFSIRNSQMIARRIQGARLTLLPGAGHAFPLEQPDALPKAIARVRQRIHLAGSSEHDHPSP